MSRIVLVLLHGLLFGIPLAIAQPLPRFEDYPAPERLQAEPAEPVLDTGAKRAFRTRLKSAAKAGPNFAGVYAETGWGCGSNCGSSAIIDLRTGAVLPSAHTRGNGNVWEHWMIRCGMFAEHPVEYRLDSRLMIVRCFNVQESGRVYNDTYYYVLEDARFRVLKKQRSAFSASLAPR